MVARAGNGAHFVEIGCWKGRSSAFMAVEIANSGKKIRFDCVDTWLGSDEPQHLADEAVKNGSLFDEFCKNVMPVKNYIGIVRMASVEAAELYGNESLDFVFIDAAHDYESVKADIEAWFPKMKEGGVLAGDDFRWKGVERAVTEKFGDHFEVHKQKGKGRQWVVHVGEPC